MATTTTNHIEMVKVDEAGNLGVLYPKNTSEDVSISPTSGTAANTAIGTDSKILSKLIDKFGTMAFKNNVAAGNLASGLMTTSTSITTENTYIADAVAVKNLNTRVNTLAAQTVNVTVSGDTLVITTNS